MKIILVKRIEKIRGVVYTMNSELAGANEVAIAPWEIDLFFYGLYIGVF